MAEKFLKKVLPRPLYRKLLNIKGELLGDFAKKSYSQEGEDMILNRIFETYGTGFYVDVGAYHPKRFSNTYFFYKRGWRGINIDAMPGSMKPFIRQRSRDINVEIPVSDQQETLTYYAFDEPAINGFIKEISEVREKEKDNVLLFKKDITTSTLKEILDKYLPAGTSIDFLSVDVEGMDLKVLKSNDWSKYIPKIILAETIGAEIENDAASDIAQFLTSQGYKLFAKTFYTRIYKHESFRIGNA